MNSLPIGRLVLMALAALAVGVVVNGVVAYVVTRVVKFAWEG